MKSSGRSLSPRRVRWPVRCPVRCTVRWPALADAALLAALVIALWGHVLAYTAGGSFVLLRDAVSTPNPPLSDAALGVGPYAARAVPQDAAMWAVQGMLRAVGLPEALALSLLVAVALVLLGLAGRAWAGQVCRLGRATPTPTTSPTAALATAPATTTTPAPFAVRAPAMCAAVWNPFVVERLLQGHWSLLLSVAAAAWLPLFVVTSTAARTTGRRVAALCALIAAAAVTPTGLAMGGVILGVAVLQAIPLARTPNGGRRRAVALAVATAALLVAAAPVLAGTALGWGARGGASGGDAAAGVAAFAARAEPGLGTFGSLLTLGGVWNAEAVPASRAAAAALWSAPALVVAAGAAVLLGVGVVRVSRAAQVALVMAVGVVAAVALAATGPGRDVLAGVINAVPAAGLLRDGQKWVGLAIPGMCVALAVCVGWVVAGVRERVGTGAPVVGGAGAAHSAGVAHGARVHWRVALEALVAVAACAVPLLAVPDAPTALRAQFTGVSYGPGWAEVNRIVSAGAGGGGAGAGAGGGAGGGSGARAATVLVLPAGSYRSVPEWAGGRPVLDPAPRLLHATVMISGDLAVGGVIVPGEGDAARRAEDAILGGASATEVAGLGVDFVLDERRSGGVRGDAATTLAGATLRYRDAELAVWELPEPRGDEAGESAAADGAAAASAVPHATTTARALAAAAHVAWAALLLGALAALAALALGGVTRVGRAPRRVRRGLSPTKVRQSTARRWSGGITLASGGGRGWWGRWYTGRPRIARRGGTREARGASGASGV